jgi:hypothetical protein
VNIETVFFFSNSTKLSIYCKRDETLTFVHEPVIPLPEIEFSEDTIAQLKRDVNLAEIIPLPDDDGDDL